MAQIINCTKIKTTTNFEKNILKCFPNIKNNIFLDQVGMFRNSGLGGRYVNKVEFVIEERFLSLKMDHNDSEGWDNYSDWDSSDRKFQNWAKSTVLALLEENKKLIKDFFFEEELEANI